MARRLVRPASFDDGRRELFESARLSVMRTSGRDRADSKAHTRRARAAAARSSSRTTTSRTSGQLRGRTVSKSGWPGALPTCSLAVSSQQLALNVSLSGNTLFQAGVSATPYVMGPTGAPRSPVSPRPAPGPRARRRSRTWSTRATAQCTSGPTPRCRNAPVRYAGSRQRALSAAPGWAPSFPANSPLATQLQTVARMIAVRDRLGMSRQVFFVATAVRHARRQLTDQPGCSAT